MWKFYLSFIACPVVGVALVFLALKGMAGGNADVSAFLILFGLGLALFGFVFGVLNVKCPKCKTRLLWKAIREKSSQNWFFWLMSLESCPICKNGSVSI